MSYICDVLAYMCHWRIYDSCEPPTSTFLHTNTHNTHTHIDAGFLRLQSCSSVSYLACSQGDGTKDGQMSCQGLQSVQLTHPQYQEPRNEAISHQFRSLSEDTEVLTDKELWFKQEVFVSCVSFVSCDACSLHMPAL